MQAGGWSQLLLCSDGYRGYVSKLHRLLLQVVNLFNMFITYGDTFLPTSNSYDELYYEIVRMHQVFDNLYCMGTSENADDCCSPACSQG